MKTIILTAIIAILSAIAWAEPIITKADDYTIQVVEQKPAPPPDMQLYDYSFLLSQKSHIEADIAKMQLELDKVNNLIAEADKLGIKIKPIEGPPKPK